jgi:hypothetical protein
MVHSVLIPIPAHNLHNVGGDSLIVIAGLWVSVAGLIIATAGLIIAIAGPTRNWWRARRAKKAAARAELEAAAQAELEATAQVELEAAERAELEERFQVPLLVAIAEDLDAAIAADDPQRIKYQLERWRREASRVHGLLIVANSDTALRCMSQSISLAREASSVLLRGESAVSTYMAARDAITAARDTLITWVSRQSRRGGSR